MGDNLQFLVGPG